MSNDTAEVPYTRCTDCKGKRTVFAHINRGEGGKHEWRHIDCSRCHGTGLMPLEMLKWIEAGRKLRADRIARDLSLREEATRLSIKVTELSARETGRLAPQPSEGL